MGHQRARSLLLLLLLSLALPSFVQAASVEEADGILLPSQELLSSSNDHQLPLQFEPTTPEEPPFKPPFDPPHHHQPPVEPKPEPEPPHHDSPPPPKPEPKPEPEPPHHDSPPPPKPEPKPEPEPPHHDSPPPPKPEPKPEPGPKPLPPPPVPPSPPPHIPAAVLSDLKISKGKLEPKFEPDVHNYSASVSYKVKKIQITASVPDLYEKHKNYTITINEVPVKSGVPSPQLKVGKAGKTVIYEIAVTMAEHKPSAYYISVHRGKRKWSFGTKLLLALAIILVIAVLAFLAYGCYVCIKSGRAPAVWPFTYFSRNRDEEYSSLSPGPGSGRP